MLRLLTLFLVSLSLSTLVLAQDAKKDETKKDEPKKDAPADDAKVLQGDWKAVSLEDEGTKVNEEEAKAFKLSFKDDTLSAHFAAKFKLDTAKKPKTIDVTPTAGPEKDRTLEGIYELKGDELKVCIAKAGGMRPADFSTKAGSGTVLLVLKKAK